MRKIGQEKNIEKKRKINYTLFSIVLLLLLVVSTISYAFMSNDSTNQNNIGAGVNGQWSINFGGTTLNFRNSPDSVKDIPVEISSDLNSYAGQIVYVSSSNQEVNTELALTLGKYTQRMQPACYGECNDNLPEKDCTENLIVFNQSNINRVYQKEKCIFIDGDLRSVDAFLYKIFGV